MLERFSYRLIPNFMHTFLRNDEESFSINLFLPSHTERKKNVDYFLLKQNLYRQLPESLLIKHDGKWEERNFHSLSTSSKTKTKCKKPTRILTFIQMRLCSAEMLKYRNSNISY